MDSSMKNIQKVYMVTVTKPLYMLLRNCTVGHGGSYTQGDGVPPCVVTTPTALDAGFDGWSEK